MITLTDSASAKVAQLLQEEDDDSLALRVGVRPGGCAGFNYEMFFDVKGADDTERSFGDVKVIADTVSAGLLTGATLDYRNGLDESGFKITNNKAQTTGDGLWTKFLLGSR